MGIVHRDVKPENILFSGDHAIVADFGIAWATERAGGERLTQTGVFVGTPAYMSPEQVTGDPVDARGDVYALGCVLYEMLAGAPPDVGAGLQAIITRKLTGPTPDVCTVRDDVPAPVGRVVARALARVPDERFSTAAELAAELIRAAVAPHTAPSSSAATAQARAGVSIAVLLFTNMSPDPESEYFSDGITEEITSALSQVRSLRVTSRTSAFAFKGKGEDVRAIGGRLKVGTVLEGSVRKAGSRIRITVQLVNTVDGFQLWIYTGLGDLDHAFEWLEKAYDERSGWLACLAVDPQLDPLRSDPRYADLVRRVGL